MRARKKPVEVEVFFYEGPFYLVEAPLWFNQAIKEKKITMIDPMFAKGFYIETLEGTMTASIGDYIIKGVKGEIYPCKPDIFHATYDVVEDGTSRGWY